MSTILWSLQALLAVTLLAAGMMKVIQGRDKLQGSMPAMVDLSRPTVRFIGSAKTLGAIGLIAPAATGIAQVLTPVAATALATVMLLAALTHGRRREPPAMAVNAILFVMLAFVACGRFGPYAI